MSEADVNSTAWTEDYSAYYDGTPLEAPCSFADMRDFSSVFLPTLYSLVFILGFLGNGLVVCVLVKHRDKTNLTDICLCNLALSDLLFVFTLPFFTHNIVVKQWTFGGFMCRFITGSHYVGFFSSIFFMITMTFDRYVVIMHAHKVARYRTLRAGVMLSAVVWMVSLWVSLPAYIFSTVTNESDWLECNFNPENENWHHYNLFSTNVLGLIVPLLVMVVCYSRIIPTLVNMRTARKHRVIKLIVFIMAAFFVSWAPYNISLFLRFLLDQDKLPWECSWEKNIRLSVAVTEALAYSHCCLNPIIYAFVGQKFMKRALKMMKKWVPGLSRDRPESSWRKSSISSRSSDVTATVIM